MSKNILDPNPFEKPALAPRGDRVANKMLTSVGAALSAWEHCEKSFGTIYVAFAEPSNDTHVVPRTYGATLAAGMRREMIQAAAETYFAKFKIDSHSESLKALLTLYQSGAARRNEIAHGVVMSGPPTPNKASAYFLFPSLSSSPKQKLSRQDPKYRFNSRDINRYRKCFDELAARAREFEQGLRAIYSSLP